MTTTGTHSHHELSHSQAGDQLGSLGNRLKGNGLASESPALVCDGLSRTFGDVQAVDGLHLTVPQGQILALVGPSGCGKTTALRLIAGFEQPDGGTIALHGQVIAQPGNNLPPEKRRIGMVFQEGALFPHLSVEQNIAYGLPRSSQRNEIVEQVLELISLTGLRNRLPYELSGGQQQRVALGRALAPNPDVLLLDEPFSNLDPKLREQVRNDVLQILRDAHITTVFVTHDHEEALFVGDVIAVMNQGRVEQSGPPEEIFHHPGTRFVAQFIGMVDFLPAWRQDDRLMTEVGSVAWPSASSGLLLTDSYAEELHSDNESEGYDPTSGNTENLAGTLEVMVRPDCLDCVPCAKGEANNGRGVIVEREFRGSFFVYRVALPSGNTVRCLLPHTAEFPIGEEVEVVLRHGHAFRPFSNQKALGI